MKMFGIELEGIADEIKCIRCKGKGVHEDKLNHDGGIIECGLCNNKINGYSENSFEFKIHEFTTINDDNHLENI